MSIIIKQVLESFMEERKKESLNERRAVASVEISVFASTFQQYTDSLPIQSTYTYYPHIRIIQATGGAQFTTELTATDESSSASHLIFFLRNTGIFESLKPVLSQRCFSTLQKHKIQCALGFYCVTNCKWQAPAAMKSQCWR